MFHRFRYEAEYYPTLNRLPLHVRMKLDVAGLKISLDDWLSFSFVERTVLCHLPCALDEEKSAFRAYLDFLAKRYRGEPVSVTEAMDSALWEGSRVPGPVREKSSESRWYRYRQRVAWLASPSALCFVQDGDLEESTRGVCRRAR